MELSFAVFSFFNRKDAKKRKVRKVQFHTVYGVSAFMVYLPLHFLPNE